jgi:putative membrane protein
MKIQERLSDSDMQRIKDAVAAAESKISGEIVPVIVDRSGRYSIAGYKGSVIVASFAFLAMILLDRYVFSSATNALFYDPVFIFLVVITGGLVGALAPRASNALKRFLIGKNYLANTTRQRAENAFLEEEVFNTKFRTGIMIFISFFEHHVIVMADKGISKMVSQQQWDKIVADLIAKIREGHIVEGLQTAIGHCGDILLEKGFVKSDDDVNELRDDLRID